MNEKDMRDLIDISKGLDNAVLKGLERGRKEKVKKVNKSNNIFKKGIMVAGLTLAVTVTAGILNPNLVSAIPGLNKVFESFNTTLFGEPTDKYQDIASVVGKTVEDSNGKITLEEAVLDDNILMLALVVESDFLKGYEGKNEGDFFNLSSYIFVNGKELSSYGTKVKKIDDNKGAIIFTGNIADLNIGENADVKLKISSITRGFESVNGKWNFKININKQSGGRRIVLEDTVEYEGSILEATEIIMSNLSNTLLLGGRDNFENSIFFAHNDYLIQDNNGDFFRTEVAGGHMSRDGEFEEKIQIRGDLSNSEYIELMPKVFDDSVSESIDGLQHTLLKTTGAKSGEYEKMLISRVPTEEELKAGYALDKVYHYLFIDKEKEFKTLNELIGTEIEVNSKESIAIKNIEVINNETKVTFESKGMYNYSNLSQLVILDEEMQDISRREGQRPVAIENEKEGLYSMSLDKIDSNKKYKMAIPMMPEIDESHSEAKWKLKIDLR